MDAQKNFLAIFGMLFCFFAQTTVKAVDCPSGWVDGSSVGMGCLGYYPTGFNWTEAQDFCSQKPHDSHLVEIKNQDQQDFLVSLLLSGEINAITMFIGLFKPPNGHRNWTWAWSMESANFTSWYPSEPTGDGNFAFIHQDYGYNWLDTDEKTSPPMEPEDALCQFFPY